jgi:hypothetical protein
MKLTGDRNQCQGCKQFFNSTAAFDKHRTGQHGVDRRCLTEPEMLDKGMAKNSAEFWVGSPMANAGDRYWQNSADHGQAEGDVATLGENA